MPNPTFHANWLLLGGRLRSMDVAIRRPRTGDEQLRPRVCARAAGTAATRWGRRQAEATVAMRRAARETAHAARPPSRWPGGARAGARRTAGGRRRRAWPCIRVAAVASLPMRIRPDEAAECRVPVRLHAAAGFRRHGRMKRVLNRVR